MNIIANVSKNWAIGKNGSLLFHISADMKFFKEHTSGNIVVMGRKTLDSLPGGRPLPNRTNIVITRNEEFSRSNVMVCHSMDELRSLLSGYESGSIYVLGGESLYRDLLPLCDTAYITKVDKDVPDADAFMPDLDNDPGWAIDEVSERFESNGLEYIFVTYKRK
nr:Dihydrofolate reductase [uncultured bacterium]